MRRVRAAELIAFFEMAQFDAQNGRLDSVHPAVPSDHGVVIFADLAVIPKNPDFLLQLDVALSPPRQLHRMRQDSSQDRS